MSNNKPKAERLSTPSLPAYWRIAQDLRLRVSRGEWETYQPLPARKALAEEYGVALNTLQQAIAALMADEVLVARGNQGTFVAPGTQPKRVLPTVDEPSGRPFTLGIITKFDENYENSWIRIAIRSIEATVAREGGHTLCFDLDAYTGSTSRDFELALRKALSTEIDAQIIVNIEEYPEWLQLSEAMIDAVLRPTVYISSMGVGTHILQVYYDQRASGYLAARHLLDAGYGKLCFLAPYHAPWLELRLAGAQDAVRESGLADNAFCICRLPEETMPYHSYRQQAESECLAIVERLLDDGFFQLDLRWTRLGIGGIIAPCDTTAKLVLKLLQEHGRVPGRDFGVIAFDDSVSARQCGLTSMRPPQEMLGEAAVAQLLRILRRQELSGQISWPSTVVNRSSTLRSVPGTTDSNA